MGYEDRAEGHDGYEGRRREVSVFDDEAKRLRREAEIESAERATDDAADKWANSKSGDTDADEVLALAVDAWRKLKGGA